MVDVFDVVDGAGAAFAGPCLEPEPEPEPAPDREPEPAPALEPDVEVVAVRRVVDRGGSVPPEEDPSDRAAVVVAAVAAAVIVVCGAVDTAVAGTRSAFTASGSGGSAGAPQATSVATRRATAAGAHRKTLRTGPRNPLTSRPPRTNLRSCGGPSTHDPPRLGEYAVVRS